MVLYYVPYFRDEHSPTASSSGGGSYGSGQSKDKRENGTVPSSPKTKHLRLKRSSVTFLKAPADK